MLILDRQIVSPLLIQTAINHSIPIYYSGDTRKLALPSNGKVLTNSESCLSILEKQHPGHSFTLTSKLMKNKAAFREFASAVNPGYYFALLTMEELLAKDKSNIPYPVVIKPNKGYSSVGVYIVHRESEWGAAVKGLYADLLLSKSMYSNSVLDGEEIIVEQWIDGDEYAVDCYINHDGKPVILNILKRMFADEHDTSDRIYYTSAPIMREMKQAITDYLTELNKQLNIVNYPFHLEVRNSKNGIVPIELNPLRFAGAGTTDVSDHAFGIKGAEYYFEDMEPQWSEILTGKDDAVYGFFCAELPSDISKSLVHSINHEGLKKEFSHILEYREITASDDRTFAVIFFKSMDMNEIHHLLSLDLSQYIQLLPSKEPVI
ncbi:ATP-grasp domain-containing protein [Jeotgalibacillus sp. ET6]|uniref:ATP-grasp domain-containing protein n=1 Tax=Jeotgalibacillus sp. ET6 TaxID=3037260 RepID=UPI002418565A|nr:ATP-grasp domain-containing protein [Jeotgalibacillus sp. ET6]MDG5471911.1 ATP-grasp domain-containing protein [Jeotgalibacillus sp. ET6]